jgi:Ca2+-binding EF-hand superfamily protein
MSIESIGSNYSYIDSSQRTHLNDSKGIEDKANKIFQKLDSNGDGSLSAAEVPVPTEIFSQMDQDQDGSISQQENLTALMNLLLKSQAEGLGRGAGGKNAVQGMKDASQISNEIFQDKDADGDGALTAEEVSMPDDLFSRIDANQDGVIDQDELTADLESHKPDGPPPPQAGMKDVSQMVSELFQDKDSDGDGALTAEEISMPTNLFTRIDTNQDGVISKDELTADLKSHIKTDQTGNTAQASSQKEAKSSSKKDQSDPVEIIGNGIDDDGDGQVDEVDANSVFQVDASSLLSSLYKNSESNTGTTEKNLFDYLV